MTNSFICERKPTLPKELVTSVQRLSDVVLVFGHRWVEVVQTLHVHWVSCRLKYVMLD